MLPSLPPVLFRQAPRGFARKSKPSLPRFSGRPSAGPVARLHREYAKARREFKRSLLAIVSFHHTDDPDELEAKCKELLALLKSA